MKPKLIILIIFEIAFFFKINAQTSHIYEGKVSYFNNDNVYIKFIDTKEIIVGDTLFVEELPSKKILNVCIVSAKSSTTCVCYVINGYKPVVNDIVKLIPKTKTINNVSKNESKEKIEVDSLLKKEKKINNVFDEKIISGRIVLSNQSCFSSELNSESHRQSGILNFNINKIGVKNLTLESYLNFSRFDVPEQSNFSNNLNLLRIYNLALKYSFKNMEMQFGRNFNSKLASIGAIDGFQFEKNSGKLQYGVILGYRPDFFNYSFNSDLFQYGAYIGYSLNSNKLKFYSNLGYIEQTSKFKTDRKYIATQNSLNFKNIDFFVSSEIELYNPVNQKIRVSSLYTSSTLRFSRKISLLISYDSRKTIIYYETYWSEVNRYLNEDINREGLRARLNFQIGRKLFTGISIAYRFQSDGNNQSINYNSYFTYSQIPFIKSDLNLSVNANESSIIKSQMAAIRLTKNFFDNKFQTNIFYRYQKLNYVNWESISMMNQYFGFGFNYNFTKRFALNAYFEEAKLFNSNNTRLNFSISQKF
jgi:hypothetical protein